MQLQKNPIYWCILTHDSFIQQLEKKCVVFSSSCDLNSLLVNGKECFKMYKKSSYTQQVIQNVFNSLYIISGVVSALKHNEYSNYTKKYIFPKSRLSILSTFTGLGFLLVFHHLNFHVVSPCSLIFAFFTLLCWLILIGCLWWSHRTFSLELLRSCSTFCLYEKKVERILHKSWYNTICIVVSKFI